MKRNLLNLLMFVCLMSVFVACNDNDEPNIPIEKELAGTYKGALDIAMNGSELATGLPKNITITKAGGVSAINLELKDFSFMGQNLGNIVISDCEMLKYRDHYAISGNQALTLPAPIGECTVVASGTLIGHEVAVNLDIKVAALNQTVKVTFKGAKLAGNESSEAKITSFTFDSEVVMEQPVINESTGKITFKINDAATDEELKLVPVFAISGKAIVYPASGVAQDFSKGKKVVYTVVAEDGTAKEYEVSVAGSQNVMKYSFEEWDDTEGFDKPLPSNELATSSEGASMIAAFIGGAPTYKTEDKKEGNYAIGLVTRRYMEPNIYMPAIISGSVFTGAFNLDYMDWITGAKLDCTRFGLSYDKKPLRFKGWYKYTHGSVFIDGSNPNNVVEVPNKKDECAIQAVLYKVDNDDEVLTGYDINDSPKRVAVAALKDGTEKKNYTYFDLEFEYLPGKSYEVGATYKLAIVCSSSKEGDFFKGAENSTLILDELEIIGE